MAGNPQVPQGTLNRARAAVQWTGFPGLNVTAPFLGKEGVSLAFEGNATDFVETMTGAVTSPALYQPIRLTINLLKTQLLSNQYEQQRQANSLLGDGLVIPDSTTLAPYQITNCAIENVDELRFNGEVASYMVHIKGYYNVNNNLFNL
jgi:hypothetical protein